MWHVSLFRLPFLYVYILQGNLQFPTVILGSVFSEYVIFYGDTQCGQGLWDMTWPYKVEEEENEEEVEEEEEDFA